MSKKNSGVVRREKIILDKDKILAPKGVKITKPLEVTVLLTHEDSLYELFIAGDPLIQKRRLTGSWTYEEVFKEYKAIVRALKQGDYSLYPDFRVRVSLDY